jgi:uncharacterized PurR-regulated membrane protein YhhQ (DUF165 family)
LQTRNRHCFVLDFLRASAQAEVRDTVVVFIFAFHCIDSFYAENVEFSLPMNGYTYCGSQPPRHDKSDIATAP